MIERELGAHLKYIATKYPVVTLTGPRQSGKTTLCKACFPDKPYVNLEALDQRELADKDPRGFLAQFPDGAIFNEFQRTPNLPSYIQELVDADKRDGLFILTGSQNLQLANTVSQSLAGRTAVLTLLPLSVSELEQSSVNEHIYAGGFPRIYDKQLSPTTVLSDYVATYLERDVRELSSIESLPQFRTFVQLCAGRVGQLVNYSNLGNEAGASAPTIKKWIGLLEATYTAFTLRPYFRNVSKRITKTPKLYFYDVGLACYLLGIESASQLCSHPLRGALFENLVVLEILKHRFNNGHKNNLMFYSDRSGYEVDIVMESGSRPILIEVKSAATFNQSFLKGFKVFKDATGSKSTTQLLVYQGESGKIVFDAKLSDIFTISHELALLYRSHS